MSSVVKNPKKINSFLVYDFRSNRVLETSTSSTVPSQIFANLESPKLFDSRHLLGVESMLIVNQGQSLLVYDPYLATQTPSKNAPSMPEGSSIFDFMYIPNKRVFLIATDTGYLIATNKSGLILDTMQLNLGVYDDVKGMCFSSSGINIILSIGCTGKPRPNGQIYLIWVLFDPAAEQFNIIHRLDLRGTPSITSMATVVVNSAESVLVVGDIEGNLRTYGMYYQKKELKRIGKTFSTSQLRANSRNESLRIISISDGQDGSCYAMNHQTNLFKFKLQQ